MAAGETWLRGRGSMALALLAGLGILVVAVLLDRTTRGDGAIPPFPGSDRGADLRSLSAGSLLVGTNYTHHSFDGCDWSGSGILASYHQTEVADEVHRHLAAMREAGIVSLRLLLWHMRDTNTQRWGVVPSRGGRLAEPYRGNLVAYLADVRRAGFSRLTISFAPQWSNNPLRAVWEPETFGENWGFVRDVRALAERFGPDDVRYDLMNEGAPSDYLEPAIRVRTTRYLQRLFSTYVDAFGAEDATISVIAPPGPWDDGNRLGNLVDLIEESGAPLPPWFELHLNDPPSGVTHGLRHSDSVLTARGLEQPLTIGEISYDDDAVAAAVQDHLDRSARPLGEVIEWYRRAGATCEVSPPFRADAYLRLEPGPDEVAHPPSAPSGTAVPDGSPSR